jgi:hypothetical protein
MRALVALTTALGAAALLAACGTYTGGGTLEANADPDALVCRSLPTLGSSVLRRYCATNAEWDAYENDRRNDAQETLRRVTQRSAVTPAGVSNPLSP